VSASGRSSLPLVIDWDGTVTETDTLHLVIEQFGDLDVFRAMEADIEHLSLHEVIAREMETVKVPAEVVIGWLLDNVRVRAGFHELVDRHDPLIVSAGFHELIDPVLAREGISARVVANHVTADTAGWKAVFPNAEACVVCGEVCKRANISGLGPFAYVGDGVSDRCVSLAAQRRFARDGLARWLDERGEPFEPFDDFGDVIASLSRDALARPA
jgi:2-hydroxy-3-keto-5-methylthiopentenyl-1-phosphate phosphatase